MLSFVQLGPKLKLKPVREIYIPSHRTRKRKSGYCLVKVSKPFVTTRIIFLVEIFTVEEARTVFVLKEFGNQNTFSVKVSP